MSGRFSQKNDAEDENNNADSYRSISHIKGRPNFKIKKISDLSQAESVNEVAYRAAQDQADTRADRHSINKGPATAQDQDKQQHDNNADKINDSKNQGVTFEYAEGSPGILDMNNPEKAGIKKQLPRGQIG
jgi:hypothetical protein